MARIDTAEVCSGAQRFLRSVTPALQSFFGMRSCKGFMRCCELPHVVPYEALDQKAVPELISKLTNEGLHVSPEEKTGGTTMETILSKGLAEKEKMLATTKPAATLPASPAAVPAPDAAHPLDPAAMDDKKTTADDKKTTADGTTKTPGEEKLSLPVEKANSSNKLMVGVLGVMGVAFSILPWVL
ncbi:hypothetical protein BGZ70_005619 [Mortierella alpina]|uniref:Uncharacterized protein n=1 Tax=Mortierella alpina TaxID=64518 RepID=A0A9P6JFL3_MORAP|nr:hypothetical protein BGZ70_005619 [Mortierella alpina]